MSRVSSKKITGKSVLEPGWHLVLVNQYGRASSTPISRGEAKAVIKAMGDHDHAN